MSDDSFVHDKSQFDPGDKLSGDDLTDVEAKYADLVADAIWDGFITTESRTQLNTAAKVFGLNPQRARQIEKALKAAHEALHHKAVVEEKKHSDHEPRTISPLARAEDPRLKALQRRIDVLERENKEIVAERDRLLARQQELDGMVAQLQRALESTLEDLDQAHKRLDGSGGADVDRQDEGPVSQCRSTSEAPPALDELDRAVENANASRKLLHHRKDDPGRTDPSEIHRLLRERPRDAELLRSLYRALGRGEDLDRRWCIAQALVYLGQADEEQQALYHRHAKSEVVRPSRAVNDDEWHELLYHPEQDVLTGEILAEIAPAVLLGQLTAIRRDSQRSEDLDEGQLIDPQSTDLPIARCFAWASAALGVRLPPMLTVPEHPRMIKMVLKPRPSIRFGKDALTSRSPSELAFIAGRHVTWYRKEHLLGQAAGSARRLEDVFLAALMIGNPGLPMTQNVKERVEPIAKTIAPLLKREAIERLRRFFTRFVEQGGRTNLARWLRAVDRTAAGTGLLLSNSLWTAEKVLEQEDPATVTDRMDELMVFLTAGRYSLLRRRIGIHHTL